MDIGRFFESLNENHKSLIFSISLTFPLAYIDCWWLYEPFNQLDLIPQIIISIGISIILCAGGVLLNGFYFLLLKNQQNLEIPIIVATSVASTAFSLIYDARNVSDFELLYLIIFATLLIFLTFVRFCGKGK